MQHYIISSGLSDVIKGCSFIKDINLVYASSYIYDNDKGVWPKLSVNYSNKVQFLYRINKGTFDVFDQAGVNAKKDDNNKAHIPFENIIFFGDGETDVPCFSVNHKNSGKNICVYEKDNEIVGTGSLLIEQKLTYNIRYLGHIENIFVDEKYKRKSRKRSRRKSKQYKNRFL